MTNLSSLLETGADRFGDRTAVVWGDQRLTYRELDAEASRVAHLIASHGVGAGDTVALSSPNVPYFPVVYFGILKTGATVVPLNTLLRSREIEYHLDDSGAVLYFAFEGGDDLPIGDLASEAFARVESCASLFVMPRDGAKAPWRDFPDTFETYDADYDDVAVILYTSGTTGQPKGAELRHHNLIANATLADQLFGLRSDEPDTVLCVLPLYHSFAQTCAQNAAFAFGCTVVLMPRFEPVAAMEIIAAEGVTLFSGVPTMFWGLLNVADDRPDLVAAATRSLRLANSGGAALPREIHRRFREVFGLRILEGYGLSETSPVASFSPAGEEPRIGSIGIPVPGVRMRLIEGDWRDVPDDPEAVGEIVISGHNVMKGYHGRPEATALAIRDGWFRTGDLARKDADGYFYIVDRAKDMIIRGGFNVYPRELEEVLMGHPAVSLVAVIGVPDESHGEEIKAVIVRNEGFEDVSEKDVIAWGREQFAGYKYPRICQFVDALPTTSTGKILKREIV